MSIELHPCLQVKMPDGIRRDQFLAWIEALSPTQQSPVSHFDFWPGVTKHIYGKW